MTTRIVTDSTAYLPREVAERHGIEVVPLHVVVGGRDHVEGRDISAAQVAAALRDYTIVTTSRPTPQVFAETYRRLVDHGATAIVSIHLSSQMSGTVEAARLAAAEASFHANTSEICAWGRGATYGFRRSVLRRHDFISAIAIQIL